MLALISLIHNYKSAPTGCQSVQQRTSNKFGPKPLRSETKQPILVRNGTQTNRVTVAGDAVFTTF